MSEPEPTSGRRVHVTTLGCKLNQYDSEMLLTQLRSEGFGEVQSARDADLVIVNTCAVTETAERKGRAAIRAALRQNARAKVVATGCQAEKSPDSMLKSGAAKVLGNREKERLAALLDEPLPVQIGGIHRDDLWSDGTIVGGLTNRVRAFLKVQDGCSQHCTYCIVPKLRGRGRSLPVERAVERAKELVDHGFHEIVMTGVALGTYGLDSGRRDALTELIKSVSKVPGLRRLRLGSVEPWAVNESFLRTVAESEVICPHLHLPFQSGCDEVLRRMNRRYTVARIERMLDFAFCLREDWGIGADIIVGFPGETSEQFERTVRFLNSSPISYLHVFPFSQRPGTAAVNLPGVVKQNETLRRANVLRRQSREMRSEFHRRQVGKRVEAIAENRASQSFVFGHARNYSDVAIPRNTAKVGQVAYYHVERADADFLYCKPIERVI